MTPPEQYWKETQPIKGHEIKFFSAAQTWDDFHNLVRNIPSFPLDDSPEARATGGLSNVDVEQRVRAIRECNATVDSLPDIWGLREAVMRLLEAEPPEKEGRA